jgi:hypothetical protein
MWPILGAVVSWAAEPTYMDRFASTPAPAATRVTPAAPKPAASAPPSDVPVDAAIVVTEEVPAAPEPPAAVVVSEVPPVEEPSDALVVSTSADELAELNATILALKAQLAASQPVEVAKARREPPEVGLTASLGVASAYVFRGLNYFHADQSRTAAIVAPSLEATIGQVTAGWWSGYQATGPDRDVFVRIGNGHEQDAYVGWGTDLTDQIAFSTQLTGYWYPFSVEEDAGANAALWLEPSVALDVDLGVVISGSAAWYQGVQEGISPRSYGYFTGGVGHSVPLWSKTSMDLGAVGGLKTPQDPSLWPSNTVDMTLSWGASWEGENVTVSPAGHLTWTNLEATEAGSETLLWFGLDTTVGL